MHVCLKCRLYNMDVDIGGHVGFKCDAKTMSTMHFIGVMSMQVLDACIITDTLHHAGGCFI